MSEVMLTFGAKPTGDPEGVFVQWKGVDICADFACPCGADGHLDGYVFGRWRCVSCGQSWSLNWNLLAYPVDSEPNDHPMGPPSL